MRPNIVTLAAVRLARLPFWLLARRSTHPPRKAIILRPCCISQVLLATPMLAALSNAYPQTQFDWAVSSFARPAIVGNPRVAELIDSGRVGLPGANWPDIGQLITTLRREQYDTCLIPGRSSILSWIAWRAGIPQRVGLNHRGRGFAHTTAVPVPSTPAHEAEVYLGVARAFGITEQPPMEFYPPDSDRAAITQRLIEQVDWLGAEPLIVLHPGGGPSPMGSAEQRRWPAARFALLGNHLARRHGARILLAGSTEDRAIAQAVAGMMSAPAINLAGQLTLGELGALCEVADLFVGMDSGSTHVAAAVNCPTLALYGSTRAETTRPYTRPGRVVVLEAQNAQPFTWQANLPPEEVIPAADQLLAATRSRIAAG